MDLKKPQLRIDKRPQGGQGGGSSPVESGGASGAPTLPRPPAPTGLALTAPASLVHSTVSPQAAAELTWIAPRGASLAGYVIEWATDSGFTSPKRQYPGADRTTETISGLPVSTAAGAVTIWFRIASIAKGGVEGNFAPAISAVMPSDTTPPGQVAGAAAAFAVDGTLEVRATPPTSTNFRTIRVEIWNATNTVQLDVSQFAGGVWTWSPTRNRERTAAAGQTGATTSVTVRLYAVSWGNVDSTVVTVSAVSAAPATPTGLAHSWQGDTGTAGADLRITWTAAGGLTYRLSIDGVLTGRERITSGGYDYSLIQNRAEHGGTPDPALALSLVAENGLGQVSTTPATATATNAPPATVSISLTGGGLSALGILLGQSSAPDLATLPYRVRLYRDAVLVDTLWLADILRIVEVTAKGSYTADVAVFDVFGQGSAPTVSAAVALDPLTLAMLREAISYRDSLGTAPATLKAVLADGQS